MKRAVASVLVLLFAVFVTGCAGGGMGGIGGSQQVTEIQQGRIEQITMVQMDHPHQLGVGAILGGAAGAGIGSLIGAGTGRDVAIAIGAIAGAVGGQYAQNRYESRQQGQQVVVRLDSGVLVVVTQPPNAALAVGQRVYVTGSGPDARVVPL